MSAIKKTMPQLVIASAANYGSHEAVKDEFSTITYKELDDLSNSIANAICCRGIHTNQFAMIMLPRTKELIVSSIGVQKAGCAMVNVDPAYPLERINSILQDCKPKSIVTTSTLLAAKQAEGEICLDGVEVILIDKTSYNPQPIDLSQPDYFGAILYTSGSTGKPKGVLYTMQVLYNLAVQLEKQCEGKDFTKSVDRFGVISDFSFIATLLVVFGALRLACRIDIISDEVRRSIPLLQKYFLTEKIAVSFLPSQLGVVMLNNLELPLKHLILGSEKVMGLLPNKPDPTIYVHNGYGMSECMFMLYDEIKAGDERYSLGRPVPGVELYLLDEQGKQVEDGQIGELCVVADDYLCAGYYGLEDLNKAKFEDCRFNPGHRMFHTGDLVRRTSEGKMYHCGRMDNMVKLRGLRIETDEIENVVTKLPQISTAVCVLKEINNHQHLCLYYQSPSMIADSAIKEHLAKFLPAYMVPTLYVHLSIMPRNERGKIDRKRLPEPTIKSLETDIVPPETNDEKKMFEIVAEVLDNRDFGVTDDLMSLGLTSLSAIELQDKCNSQNIVFTEAMIKKARSIRNLLKLINEEREKDDSATLLTIQKCNPTKKFFPLSFSEQLPIVAAEKAGEKAGMQIRRCIELPAFVNPQSLVQAIEDTVKAHNVYTATRIRKDGWWGLLRNDIPVMPDITIEAIQKEQLDERIDQFCTPSVADEKVCRFQILHDNEHTYLLFRFSHNVADMFSVSLFMKEAFARYMGDRNVVAESFNIFDWLSYKEIIRQTEEAKQAVFVMDSMLKNYPFLPRYEMDQPLAMVCDNFLSSEDIKSLYEIAKRYRTNVQTLIRAAFALATMHLTGIEAFTYQDITHGRFVTESLRIHGNLASFIPTMTSLPQSMRYDDYLQGNIYNDELVKKHALFLDYVMESHKEQLTSIVTNMRFNTKRTLSETIPIRIRPTGHIVANKAALSFSVDERSDSLVFSLFSNHWSESKLRETLENVKRHLSAVINEEESIVL